MAPEKASVAANPSQKQISDKQRARITENFRAAKALLARKRPPQPVATSNHPRIPPKKLSAIATSEIALNISSSSGSRNMNVINLCGSSLVNELPRYPLAEIQANRMDSRPVYKTGSVNFQNVEFSPSSDGNQRCSAIFGVYHTDGKPSTTSSLEMDERQDMAKLCVSPKSNSDLEKENKTSCVGGPMSNSHTSSSEVLLESASSRSCASLIDITDDEFDDALLEEIDALCAKRSMPNQENMSTAPLSTSRENLGKMPSLNSNASSADVVDWPSLEQTEADCVEEFLGTKICPMETVVHGSTSLQPANVKFVNVEEVLLSDSVSFATSHKQSLAFARVKTEQEDTCALQLEILKAHQDANIQAACGNIFSNFSQDSGSSRINSGETTCNHLVAHASNTSNNFQYESSNLSNLSVSTSETLPAYLQSLNDTQREAATSDITKPLLILAGPGSGKTSTMVARLLTLLKEGIPSTNILAMTFTTAAATEMRQRVEAVVGKMTAKGINMCTFHSFCLQLCRLHADKLGRTSEFLIYGHGQQRRAVIEAVRLATVENQGQKGAKCSEEGTHVDVKLNVESCKENSKRWQQFVTQAKAAGRAPEDYVKMGNEMGAAILGHYNATLAACNALDYHDFISCAVKLLSHYSEVLEECQKSWTAILVDEFQDTSSMQYCFLRLLSSHNHITVVGDDDQSIFSFNGADISGFDSFRKDFPSHKEVRLHQNYRSTRCIVEAASFMIRNNVNRCQLKHAFTDNVSGDKIMVRECRNEDAQCAFVVDTILMNASENSTGEQLYSNIAILYRRQVSGKLFQSSLRARKIPFNVHGVAFYRKKVIKVVISMLQTALPGCGDLPCRRAFKALYTGDKSEQKRVIEYVEKVANSVKCGFLIAARDVFTAKVSGTFNRRQLAQGRKVLFIIDRIYKLVRKEQSLSAVVTSTINFLPQKFLLEKRAIVDEDGGKLLNEDEDHRSVLEYLLDDVSDFLCNHFNCFNMDGKTTDITEEEGCLKVLKVFLDYLSTREMENFRCRRENNKNSVTLTTMHQSKGLEWDTVFIVKANDSEIPLLHETMGSLKNGATSLEEERRLFYVAMTRARKKLYILYVVVDSNWQLLHPSRFLKELPRHLVDVQDESTCLRIGSETCKEAVKCLDKNFLDRQVGNAQKDHAAPFIATEPNQGVCNQSSSLNMDQQKDSESAVLNGETGMGNAFLRGFSVEARSTVAGLFHTWAKKRAFQDPKRLLDKVGFVIDERMRNKTSKNKDVLQALKSCLKDDEAFQYAKHVLRWEQMPSDERSLLLAERQEHFQKQGFERSMDSAAATSKQIAYLQNLGCTINPTSRLHASRLIEQYKSL